MSGEGKPPRTPWRDMTGSARAAYVAGVLIAAVLVVGVGHRCRAAVAGYPSRVGAGVSGEDGVVYVAPIEGGHWTPLGYIAGETLMPAEECVLTWTDGGIEVRDVPVPRPVLRLDPDDGRDQPQLPDVSNVALPPQPGAPIAAVTSESYLVYGQYRRCATCRAPVVSPFPADWRIDLSRVTGRTSLTPHRPDCDAPSAGIAIKAEWVHDLSLDLGRWVSGA